MSHGTKIVRTGKEKINPANFRNIKYKILVNNTVQVYIWWANEYESCLSANHKFTKHLFIKRPHVLLYGIDNK